MTTYHTPFRFRAFVALSFIAGSALLSPAGVLAQTRAGRAYLAENPGSLRVVIGPGTELPGLKLCVENGTGGTSHILIRDEQGRLVHEEVEFRTKFAMRFDLADLPAGTYTMEVCTRAARHSQRFRIEPPTANRFVMIPDAPRPAQTSSEIAAKQ